MIITKQQAKENLTKLINKFKAEISSGRAYEFNEEATKMAFIEPLLKDVLGWDVNDHNEVSPEHKVSRKRVDYSLKVDGKIQLFIEAKPVKADLENHIDQAVKYGYNRKDVSFVLLTDFESLMLFDVTIKPEKRNPKKGLKLHLSYKEYETKFDKLWLLSKESVASGELNNLLREKPKNQQSVDKAILKDLEGWRETLAKDLYKNNPHLFKSEHAAAPSPLAGEGGDEGERDADYLKEITQRLLDRIIFMRFAEDRDLTHRPHLHTIFADRADNIGPKAMIFLKEEFKHYDIIFNSDLFALKEWEKDLAIDFKVMKDIVEETYNPYQFDVIPLEVLGNIYEQYLGYTIRLTEHQVKFERKPDVIKAGGVYYTPEYIVDYIVKNTVGKMLGELSPAKAKKITILDPACGSGSFLIRAYTEMLNWYAGQKQTKLKKSSPSLSMGEGRGEGELSLDDKESSRALTIQEKAEILKTHIFGVDIDPQAVEVTKLSLMFKMLEGEHGIVFGRGVLPMLDKNIKCGNSLIGTNILTDQLLPGEEERKLNPFDFEARFPAIMRDGGFDIVIGNPPYLFITEISVKEKALYFNAYKTTSYRYDVYGLFIEVALTKLLKTKGILSYIIPHTLLSNDSFSKLRKLFLQKSNIKLIIDIGPGVFIGAKNETMIFIVNKNEVNQKNGKMTIIKTNAKIFPEAIKANTYDQNILEENGAPWIITTSNTDLAILSKIEKQQVRLGMLATINQGLRTGDNDKYLFPKRINNNMVPVVGGKDIGRYEPVCPRQYVLYDPEILDAPRKREIFESSEKIIVQEIRNITLPRRIIAAFDNSKTFCLQSTNVINLKPGVSNNILFLLGIINSNTINFFFVNKFLGNNHIASSQLASIPIPQCQQDLEIAIFRMVEQLLDAKKYFINAKTDKDKTYYESKCMALDRQIDELVYKLYGLTKEEIKIVEGDNFA